MMFLYAYLFVVLAVFSIAITSVSASHRKEKSTWVAIELLALGWLPLLIAIILGVTIEYLMDSDW